MTADFPAFRKYKNTDTWFKIESTELFTELKRMGKYFSITEIRAGKYPERMYINDLLRCTFDTVEIVDETEFNSTFETWKATLKLAVY